MNVNHEVESQYPGFHLDMLTKGYTVIPQFIDDHTCNVLKAKLELAIENYQVRGSARSKADKYLIHDLLCQDICFGRLLEDTRLQMLLSPLLGESWILYAYTSSSLPPGEGNFGSRLHVDSPRLIPNYPTNIGVMWALDDFTLENGATKMLPGSHHTDLVPVEEYFENSCVQLTCKRGALIIFNARVWHRAGINMSTSWRHSLTMNACRSYMKQRMDWVRFIPSSISDQLNEQGRRIIGFDTRLPTNLDELFLPESERLYKPNQG
ncbi:phytanoyl-CoA dioxygenase family protein [Cohnella sp. GbtcB17]|uniref:phytanoyl-CoA dioxygenase family protein n=1 Tax=Cohnella sp. GbtcB17 TaxID=2824762 RepID=UPI001C300C64